MMTVSPGPRAPGNAPIRGQTSTDPALALAPTAIWSVAGLRTIEHGSTGRFPGAALFLDVSGFTTLSEALGRLGSAGTEELVRTLNGFFEPAIDMIRRAGGEVVAFGGDAISAVWPGADAFALALGCGQRLAERSRDRGTIATSVGEFSIAVRIGVAPGDIRATIGGTPERLVIVTDGPAIDDAVAAEAKADLDQVQTSTRSTEAEGPGSKTEPGSPSMPAVAWDPSRFAHPVVVERMRRGDTTLIDGHRRVTTLFAHLPELETDEPEPLAAAVRSIVELANELGGEVIQITGGDKGTVAMLTFGAPTSSPEDARRAVAAGVRLTDTLAGISIGIGTGTVFAGLVGGSSRSVYTVIGDTVNLAARLMQHAEPGCVVVDGSTADDALATFTFEDRGLLRVKGKLDEVAVAQVTGQRRRLWPTNRLATDGPLVGRGAELAAIEQALEPSPGIQRVVIEGGAGIGKSRLLRAMADDAAARGWLVVAGGASGIGETAPYAPWQPVLRSAFGDDDVARTVARLVPDSEGLHPLLGPLLGMPFDETASTSDLEGEVRNELAEELAARLLVASAHERPLLIQLEDWQWADPSSEQLLGRLSAEEAPVALTMAITRRIPSAGPMVAPHSGDVRIELTELGPQATRELAASASARTGAGLDAERLARIVELAGGNPLMVETLMEVDEDAVMSTGLAPLLQARLDRLPDGDLRSLLWASAYGRPVRADELGAAMAEGGERSDDLTSRLDRLVADGVLTTAVAPALGFRHASIREAAYERLSHESRRRVHHSVAVVMEGRDAPAIEIASHLVLTDDLDRQRRWFPRAGSQAREAWAVDDAVSWLDRALDLGESSDDVRIGLAELLMVRGDLERVPGLVDEPSEDPSIDRRRLTVAGERAMIAGANDEAVATLTEAERVATGSGSAAQACATGELLSRALLETGRIDEALETAQGLERDVPASDHDTLARAIGAYGVVQIMLYDLPGAVATLRRAVGHAEAGQDRVRLIHLLSDLAAAHAMSGDASSALEAMLAAREVAEGIGYRRHLALSVSNEAQLRLLLGDGQAALALSMRGLRDAVSLGDVGLGCDNLLRLADDPVLDIVDRRAILDRAMPLEAGLGRPHTKVEYETVGLEIAGGEPGGVPRRQARAILEGARALGRPDLELRVLLTLGEQADRDDLTELETRLEEPGDLFLVGVALRRVSAHTIDDDELLRHGLGLYRATPYASYLAGLAELGERHPPTDVVVPEWKPEPDDPVYDLGEVLDTIEHLIRGRLGSGVTGVNAS